MVYYMVHENLQLDFIVSHMNPIQILIKTSRLRLGLIQISYLTTLPVRRLYSVLDRMIGE
jgi:hypothetical protein